MRYASLFSCRSGPARDCREPLVLPDFRRDAPEDRRPASLRAGRRAVKHPGLRTILEDIIPKRRTVEAYEVEHEFPSIGRRVMLLNARRVFDEDGSACAILLAIEDVTRRREADREKDDLLQAKEILLQEMQHRVANSLQIIASILLLKARTVQSEETRLHLQDAHQRVMSVATVQQQLHASGLNEKIEIGPYLTKLCAGLAASMIGERRPLSIKVLATAGGAVSSEAVSIGLIVTELVINALKHGFPAAAEGEILVSYDAQASGWRLWSPTMDRGRRS